MGSQLLSTVCDALAARGTSTAQLWVFRENAASVALYRNHCRVPDGQTRVQEELEEHETPLVKTLPRGRHLGATP